MAGVEAGDVAVVQVICSLRAKVGKGSVRGGGVGLTRKCSTQ